ncbi:MAG: FKBP-type peptidyl-prolyl cis-trans isomerase [Myxococcales bacterium]|nr:FKBP-type peptidyl-prolyl cis-trans isomerase [Myxococcales bacterium]
MPTRRSTPRTLALAAVIAGAWAFGACRKPAERAEPKEAASAAPAAASAPAARTPPADLESPPADAQKTKSGLITKVLKPGTGELRPTLHDSVRVRYAGWKTSGKLIDSSSKRGGPQTFQLRAVIPGWAEGLQQMRVGERRRLWIPHQLGYLRPGRPPSTVVFDIELLEIMEGEARAAPPDVAAVPADATRSDSGLAYKVLAAGVGEQRPRAWDRVALGYAGWTPDGEMFEVSSSATFDVSAVMPGWSEALQRMTVGERVRLWIPEALAYQGRSGPPRGMVVFELELRSIERRPEPPSAPADVAAAPKNAKRTPSGLAYRLVTKGSGGERPGDGARVRLHYSGWKPDGTLLESSLLQGKPRTVPLRSVMPGWREGLQLMSVGDRALFWIPEPLAYAGAAGAPAGMLVYELELIEILN